MTENGARFTIGELATRGGVSRRTVRYYVQRGLLPAPLGTGRGPHYASEHLEALVRIRDRQRAGVSLEVIKRELSGEAPSPPPMPALPAGEVWTRFALAPGVELHVEAGAAMGTRAAELARRLMEELAHEARQQTEEGGPTR